jgi:hypothetical protein
MSPLRRALAASFATTLFGLGSAPAAAADSDAFVPLPGFERVRGIAALAVDASGARVAVGTHSSVWLAERGAPAQRAVRAGAVRDLAFAADGALWIASERGVISFANGVATPHALGAGASGSATRLLWLGDVLLAGAEDGLWLRPARDGFTRVDGALPEGAVRALAPFGGRSALAIVGGEIARIELDASARGPSASVREALPAGDGAPLDLAPLPGGGALCLRERGLAQRDVGGAWQRVPLALPPGAEPARLLASEHGVWIATSAGALFARAARGPYERVAPPAGSANLAALARHERTLLLAGPRGALQAELRAHLPAAHGDPRAALAEAAAGEPPVLSVQRAALRYLALEPRRLASLRERTRRSALLPVLEVFGGVGGDRSRQRDWDQAFTSGLDREFLDRRRARGSDYDAGARVTWNLGGAIYHPEEIDAARETREWIELRDEVLDEVAQLYFERRRAQLDAARETDPHAAARLALRAAELAAGLDAWTGGWWSAQLTRLSPERPDPEITR